jgi:uncharacterized protein (TIGR03118 family)
MTTRRFCSLASLGALAMALGAAQAHATQVGVIPLVTDDQTANPARITDTGLVNAWGISYGPSGPFWVSANGAGVSNIYSVNPATQVPQKLGLTVGIPGNGSVTGQAFNSTSGFNGDLFLFASEDGTVSGWRGSLGTTAEILAHASPDNIYKGLATGTVGSDGYAYATNFKSGHVDVFKGSPTAPILTGNFTDPGLPTGYAPFGIQNIDNTLYVTFAQQVPGSTDEAHGAGLGFVDAFDLSGNFLRRVASQGALNAPWGLAIAPSSFGKDAGALLVGNFGDGTINAFDPSNGTPLGPLLRGGGSILSIEGLWGLTVGNDGAAGSSQKIYFSAGPNDEGHGLFGVLTPGVPEPTTWMLMLLGFGLIGAGMRRARRQGIQQGISALSA